MRSGIFARISLVDLEPLTPQRNLSILLSVLVTVDWDDDRFAHGCS
jgi:hypothetical protein